MGAHADHDMGHTVAGWTGTAVVTLGFAVAGAAFVAGSGSGLWAGAALILLGALAAWALHLAGRGKATGPRPPELRHWRTPDPAGRHGHPDCLGCRLAGRRSARATGPAATRATVGAAAPAAAPAPGAGARV
ncbi:HGxxPAAW family protein [Kitasatospora sp. NPDC089913]|uniref:HGxxPAAW family protein n=1 Tax=Kitasatospora sp. NPDC089913 TaxID=3364080 RepID=UPI0038193112